ncbi:MAG TPA: PilZ domain-containing protein [Bryobacteraceae bacterium]|nr:PilZ domain-containing protein [Bryobacteraceae bacterium]
MEQRRTRRFKLQLPLSITRAGAERVTFAGFTDNISSSGVLFTVGREPDLGSPIEYIITLNHDGPQAVNLRCVGKVLRSEKLREPVQEQPPTYQIAATLERYEFVRDR